MPESIADLRAMIMQADEMLYEEKKTTKDRMKGGAFERDHVPSQDAIAHYNNLRIEK